MCRNFQNFEQYIKIFKKKSFCLFNFFNCLELMPIRIDRIRIGMPWMPLPIRTTSYRDADLTRQMSKELLIGPRIRIQQNYAPSDQRANKSKTKLES